MAPFIEYVRAVGTGKKGNRDLSYEEAKDMFEQILSQEPDPIQIGAFLLGWRLKPETITEYSAALEVIRSHTTFHPVPNTIELGYPYDGKRRNPYIFPVAAQYMKESGISLVVSADQKQPAKEGITVRELSKSYEFDEQIICFDREEFAPKVSALSSIRQALGIRTAFNTLEKLHGVAHSEVGITGVFHKPYVKKYAQIFSPYFKRLVLIQGNEGTMEIFSKAKMWIVVGEEITEYSVDPHQFGIEYEKSWERISFEDSLHMIQEPTEEFLKLAKLNAAVWLFGYGYFDSIEEGYATL
ncbi:MAG: glycosyl transferase [Epsilonproteobacteria bacterium]|nr:glycosyl transferase [Campylobacterota bacterium]